ncbi:hypothetical protein LTR95_019468, partial [Oleoguttula sp. CCFEE 5521]
INTTPPDLLTGQRGRQPSQLSAASGLFTPRMDTPASFISTPKIGDSLARHVGLPPLNTSRRADSSASSSLVSPTDSVDNLMLQDSWAAKAKRAAKLPPPEPAPRPIQGPADIIRRNRKGQRIDSSIEYESDAFNVVKKLKLCNQHYLMPDGCNKSHKCHHRHDYRPTDKEMKKLRAVARETPCKRGTACEEEGCIHGHRCPFPMATEGSSRGIGCLNGKSCRFPREMHGIVDLAPVRMTKITGI